MARITIAQVQRFMNTDTEQGFGITGMRVMTGDTFGFIQRNIAMFFGKIGFCGIVTGKTKLITRFGQQICVG